MSGAVGAAVIAGVALFLSGSVAFKYASVAGWVSVLRFDVKRHALRLAAVEQRAEFAMASARRIDEARHGDRITALEMWREEYELVDDIDPDTDADGEPFTALDVPAAVDRFQPGDEVKIESPVVMSEKTWAKFRNARRELELAAELLEHETGGGELCRSCPPPGDGEGHVGPHEPDCRVGMFLRRIREGS